jgi:hypothetical protein
MSNPRYPVYILSKGRWESRLTSKALERMNVPYHIVVEPQEYDNYAAVIDPKKIIVTPFSNLGQGAVPVRNFIWDLADKAGAKRHWQLDDNIQWFARLHKNRKVVVTSGACFRVVEDLADRYENVAQAGMQYEMFTPAGEHYYPVVLNTRIYSCVLNPNWLDYRYRGRYNDDTDLSLRILKDGWCTILVQAFICKKMTTMTMKGGMGKLYEGDGRLKMVQSLVEQHPDVATIYWRWGRWQHRVDYSRFKKNKLILKRGVKISDKPNNYGLVLKKKNKEAER